MTGGVASSLTLGDIGSENRRRLPGEEAAVCGAGRWTYEGLDARVNRLANRFLTQGFEPGERVLWIAQNCHRLLETVLATAKLGGVCCPVNWRCSVDELAFVIDDFRPRLAVWQEEEIGAKVRQARDQSEHTEDITWIQSDAAGADGYEGLIADGSDSDPDIVVRDSEPVLAMYTAAFAGHPNAALITHRGVVAQNVTRALFEGIGPDTVFLNAGPLFHAGAFAPMIATFHFGGKNVFMRRPDPLEICRLIEDERCTTSFLVPALIRELVESNGTAGYDLSSLRSASVTEEWDEMVTIGETPRQRNPDAYGQTETMGLVLYGCLGGEAQHGRSSPLALVRILDQEGLECPPGEIGEIAVRGPMVMDGYLGRDELNAERRKNGWHLTHDLGRRLPDGSIEWIAPMSRMIKSGAENIYVAEVERCLMSHPQVADCAVIGVPDPKWTQSVKALVVPEATDAVTADALIEHCRAHLASYKKPREVEFIESIPRRGATIDYEALDARFGGGGYPGSSSKSALAVLERRHVGTNPESAQGSERVR